MIKRLKQEDGYSLVEVVVSIMILTVAIIPMVSMFDAGFKAANTSGNYDTARAFANKKLEQAKSLSYARVQNNFPRTPPATQPTDGSTSPSVDSATEPGVPNGFSYTVSKRYLRMAAGGDPTRRNLDPFATDEGLVEVTVTVSWGSGNSYATSGVVAKATP